MPSVHCGTSQFPLPDGWWGGCCQLHDEAGLSLLSNIEFAQCMAGEGGPILAFIAFALVTAGLILKHLGLLKPDQRHQPATAGFFMGERMMDLELGHTRLILEKCVQYGALRNQAAYILATARWETAHTMEPVREAYWLSEVWRRANLRYYPWYGRGFVQLTWEVNYQKAGRILSRDLTTDPDVVMEPEISAEILVRGSMDGWFTGKKIGDYITLSKSNFKGARRVINGTDKAASIAAIARDYDRLLKEAGYGEGAVSTPPPPDIPKPDDTPSQPPQSGFFVVLMQIIRSLFK